MANWKCVLQSYWIIVVFVPSCLGLAASHAKIKSRIIC